MTDIRDVWEKIPPGTLAKPETQHDEVEARLAEIEAEACRGIAAIPGRFATSPCVIPASSLDWLLAQVRTLRAENAAQAEVVRAARRLDCSRVISTRGFALGLGPATEEAWEGLWKAFSRLPAKEKARDE